MSRQRAITAADFAAVRRGFVDAGLDEEYLNGDDIVLLWNRGCSVGEIVTTALAFATRIHDRTATPSPT